jgi:Zn-dependent protease with chaperone function
MEEKQEKNPRIGRNRGLARVYARNQGLAMKNKCLDDKNKITYVQVFFVIMMILPLSGIWFAIDVSLDYMWTSLNMIIIPLDISMCLIFKYWFSVEFILNLIQVISPVVEILLSLFQSPYANVGANHSPGAFPFYRNLKGNSISSPSIAFRFFNGYTTQQRMDSALP